MSSAHPADAAHELPGHGVGVRRLLAAFDGSDASAAACAFALWLAGKGDARTALVHVSPEPHAAHAAPPDALLDVAEQRLATSNEWRCRLDALREYAARDARVDTVVVRGRPAGALLAEAAARDTDLILMGSTGVGWARGALLGSVSSQVVEHAPCSVMVFREGQTSSPAHVDSIVVGVDGSPEADQALASAAELVGPLGAQLVLVYAYEPSIALAPPTSDVRAELRRAGADILARAQAALPADAGVAAELVEDHARSALMAACEQHGPAVLAVGSRGVGGFKDLLLGSTSRWMLNHASCPVLVARRRRPAGQQEEKR